MTETAEELAANHPRRELEEMAEKLGIGTIGIGTKVSLAAAIIEAKEKASAKEAPKVIVKAPRAEVKAQVKPAFGKKGVLAKRADMDNKAKEMHKSFDAQIKANEKAVARIGSGIKQQIKANEEAAAKIGTGIDAQIKENEDAVAKIGPGIDAQMKENEKAVARIGSGVTELQNEMGNYTKDFYYG
ncbi:MAG: hypothetical protein KKD46_04895 [Euryarchaeota archaeon]|nr:hypothetical protein [Euryarchaeota archaeon]MBU4340237.1 hypothetical protein [Euryarchaeota archaeon]MCG2735905.1 hypothetical protein [Candidatus Methanoperedenaceae archaeon]